jgi:hypothetical protein
MYKALHRKLNFQKHKIPLKPGGAPVRRSATPVVSLMSIINDLGLLKYTFRSKLKAIYGWYISYMTLYVLTKE